MIYYVGDPYSDSLTRVDAKSLHGAWIIFAKSHLVRHGDNPSPQNIANRIEELKDEGVKIYNGLGPLLTHHNL